MTEGLLLIVSGPSGAGKGMVCSLLRDKLPDLRYSISATTRQPRPGEADGVDYYFVSEKEFLRLREAGALLEWVSVYGNYYGTPLEQVRENLRGGHDVLLEIDVQGALRVKDIFPGAATVFILPPSYQELTRRLVSRGTDAHDQVKRRLHQAPLEIGQAHLFDYIVVNQEATLAMSQIEAIMIAEKLRAWRVAPNLLQEANQD